MINEILQELQKQIITNVEHGIYINLPTPKALTAIYEIGLEVIDRRSDKEHGVSRELFEHGQLIRASQRKAWAKACGAAEK